MFHLTFKAKRDSLLFHTHAEARVLWRGLMSAFPELEALCLMPNHGHLQLPHGDPGGRLGAVLQGYAQWRNHRRREAGPVFQRSPPAEPLADGQKSDTVRRYIELNPCRARLVDDPLRWPWSTARDAVGFAAGRAAVAQPDRYFSWLAADPSVQEGGGLPRVRYEDFAIEDVMHAVCAYFRATLVEAEARGPLRTAVVRVATAHGVAPRDIVRRLGCDRATVFRHGRGVPSRAARFADPVLAACVRLVGDTRFRALPDGDLRLHGGSLRFRR